MEDCLCASLCNYAPEEEANAQFECITHWVDDTGEKCTMTYLPQLLRATKEIQPGEEIRVYYGYNINDLSWWKKSPALSSAAVQILRCGMTVFSCDDEKGLTSKWTEGSKLVIRKLEVVKFLEKFDTNVLAAWEVEKRRAAFIVEQDGEIWCTDADELRPLNDESAPKPDIWTDHIRESLFADGRSRFVVKP